MSRFMIARIVMMLSMIWFSTLFVFIMIRMVPGDPALVMEEPKATMGKIDQLREPWGFKKPFYIQYAIFIKRTLVGDLGRSIYTGEPAISEAMRGLKYSSIITVPAFLIPFPTASLVPRWPRGINDERLVISHAECHENVADAHTTCRVIGRTLQDSPQGLHHEFRNNNIGKRQPRQTTLRRRAEKMLFNLMNMG